MDKTKRKGRGYKDSSALSLGRLDDRNGEG